MKLVKFLVVVLCLYANPCFSASTGTAWGTVIGFPSCSGLGTDRTCILGLTQDGVDVNTYTAVYCQYPYDTICEAIQFRETVIISFSLRRFGAPCVGHFFYEPYFDGSSLAHYCYPGPCGAASSIRQRETKTKLFDVFSYTPNSGTADACRPNTSPCQNVELVAIPAIRDDFDVAVPGFVGHEVKAVGFFASPSEFIVTEVPTIEK